MDDALLTLENHKKGLLVDDRLMAGVTEHPDRSGRVVAFVLDHNTGEYVDYRPFDRPEDAIAALNAVKRPWKYEATGGCGNGDCANAASGKCPGGLCGKSAHAQARASVQA